MAPTGGVVRSLDNVPIQLPLAGVATRGLAFALDSLLLGLLTALVFIVGLSFAGLFKEHSGWAWALVFLAAFLVQWGYFALSEVLMQGRTPGKAALKLRVVTTEGGMPPPGALVLRNLVRLIPDLFVGVFLMAADPLARRAGDRLAGTLVIHEGEERSPIALTRIPPGWGGAEVATVEAYLERAAILEAEVSWALGERIIRWLERDHPQMLEGVERANRHPASVLMDALGVERL